MPFTIRPFRRLPVQCAVTYNAGTFLTLPLTYFSGFGSGSRFNPNNQIRFSIESFSIHGKRFPYCCGSFRTGTTV